MKILHVIRTEISAIKFLIPFIKAQEQQGNTVLVACGQNGNFTELIKNNIDVVEYNLRRNLSIGNIWLAIKSLKKIILQEQVDLVITHMPLASAVARLAVITSLSKTKILYVAHGLPCAPHQGIFRWYICFMAEWVLGKFTDALFLMNNYDFNLSVRTRIVIDKRMIRKIPGMGVDLTEFHPGKSNVKSAICRRFGVQENAKLVLFVGRMIREKGVFDLLEAALLLKDKGYVFILIGSGPLDAEIKKIIEKKGLKDIILFLGWQDDVHEFMQGCDMLALPTYYFEGLPVVILEAMACSKPVVSTKHRGPQDIVIDGQTGYLINIRSPRELSAAIQKIGSSDIISQSMGKLGRCHVEQYYSIDKCVKSFLNEVDEIWNILKD